MYDPRLVQTPPVYGVQKGALSISTSPFSALSANSTQHTYQILVPSLNVFVDRKIVWNTGVFIRSAVCPTLAGDKNLVTTGSSASIDVIQGCDPRTEQYRRTLFAHQLGPVPVSSTAAATSLYPRQPGDYYEFVCPGTNFNLSPFPLQTLCNNMTCSINDCSVVTNGDTLQEQILLSNTRMTQRIRTTPSKFDQYAWTQDDVLSGNGNMSSFTNAKSAVGEIPTGAWPIAFQNPQTGVQLGQFGSYVDPINGQNVYFVNGRPVIVPGGQPALSQTITLETPPATGPGNGAFSIASSGGIIAAGNQSPQTFIMYIDFTAGLSYWPGLPPLTLGTNATSNLPIVFMVNGIGLDNVHLLATNVVCTSGALAVTFQVAQLNVAGVLTYPSTWTGSNNTATGAAAFNGTGICNLYGGLVTQLLLPASQQILSTLLGQVTPDGVLIQATNCKVPTEISFQYTVAEPIVMSPFIWQDPLELNTVGLYGCTNIQFVMNLQAPSPACQVVAATTPITTYTPYWQARLGCDYPSGGNLIRCSGITGAFSNVRLIPPNNTASTYGPFTSPRLLVQFLTPGPDISLPLISNVPYTEFPRYFKQDSLSTPTSIQNTVASQTITLSSIPDVLMVFVKTRKRSQMQNETYYPIRGVQITFDNFSNLCANMTQDQLYQASVEAGLDMDWHTWRGYTNSTTSVLQGGSIGQAFAAEPEVDITSTPLFALLNGLSRPISSSCYNTAGTYAPIDISSDANSVWPPSYGASAGGLNKFSPKRATQLTGGPLMLRMGQDISLSPGLAPGTLGNFSLQVNLVLDNQYGFFDAYPDFQMTIIAVNSGYLETVRGQSAVRKTILNMADVEAAHADSGLTTTSLRRLVGGAMPSLAHLGNFASKLASQVGGPALGNLVKRMRPGSGL